MARFIPLCEACEETRTDHRSGCCKACRTLNCVRCQRRFVAQDPDEDVCTYCLKAPTVMKTMRTYFQDHDLSMGEIRC